MFWFGLGGYENLGHVLGENARGLRILERFVPGDEFALVERIFRPLIVERWPATLASSPGTSAISPGRKWLIVFRANWLTRVPRMTRSVRKISPTSSFSPAIGAKPTGFTSAASLTSRLGERELAIQRLTAALEIRERLGHGRIEETRRALESLAYT